MPRGAIRSEEAYALGKMLDHSAWAGVLPRNVTPSDVDMCFDNAGRVIFGELSSEHCEWRKISVGQRRLYQGLIDGSDKHCAVVCRHCVSPSDHKKIDTRNDIVAFQIMVYDDAAFALFETDVYGSDEWQRFVLRWFDDPHQLRQRLLNRFARAA